MDTLTFIVLIVLVMLAMQHNQYWLVFICIGLLLITSRDVMIWLLMGVGIFLFFVVKAGGAGTLWPWLVVGLIGIAIIIALGKKEEAYTPGGGYGDLLAGLGGLGGGYGGGLGGLGGGEGGY